MRAAEVEVVRGGVDGEDGRSLDRSAGRLVEEAPVDLQGPDEGADRDAAEAHRREQDARRDRGAAAGRVRRHCAVACRDPTPGATDRARRRIAVKLVLLLLLLALAVAAPAFAKDVCLVDDDDRHYRFENLKLPKKAGKVLPIVGSIRTVPSGVDALASGPFAGARCRRSASRTRG